MARYADVVVLIPGILGSALSGPGSPELWGTSPGALLRNAASLGGRLKALELAGDDPEVDDLGDGIRPTHLIRDAHLLPGLWKIDGYGKLGRRLVAELGVVPGGNYFEFSYDWRRDNRVAARLLARDARRWLAAWRETSGNASAKLVLVSHSMGGLIARHFLEVLDGWRDTALLATFGTPFRGAPKALAALCNGVKWGGIADLTPLVRGLTSVHQLLPVYPAFVAEGGERMRLSELPGLPHVRSDAIAAARRFHDDIRDAQARNAAEEGYARDFRVLPFVGTGQPTSVFARAAPAGIELLRRHAGQDHGGDGTVPRVSALPTEWDTDEAASFVADAHASLQNSDAALTQLCGRLRGAGIDYGAFRDVSLAAMGVEVEDVYAAGRPVALRATVERYRPTLDYAIDDVETGALVESGRLWPLGDGAYGGEVTLGAGVYRIRLGGAGTMPVSDLFTVA